MKRYSYLAVTILISSSVSWASDKGSMIKPTELKTMPKSQAKVIRVLKKDQSVVVKKRQGGWYFVDTSTNQGWVKMFFVRFENLSKQRGRIGLSSVLKSTQSAHSDITMTTGVRGLSEESLKNAKPNFVQLAELTRNRSSKKTATEFARQGKLKARKQQYVTNKEQEK
ncbi:hypothetical protein [Pleionea sp. CnH1-48]|uniref:hypothetical protein n=1 Tax=Pleionea sp. CnH1-48 TaxID=2954494 RepID=UPI00209721A8|nr:hypothetical protein [Pleionea sp. CnH1-48]MCO7225502.1 hypothetical protein [Pleionea sp. CnH1-48]